MFNDCNSKTNGEQKFFTDIKEHIDVIFDVGCRNESEYIHFGGEVHYFDPVNYFIQDLKRQPNANKKSYFNNFGLGDKDDVLYYYPKYESFYDRVNSCHVSDDANKLLLEIKKGGDYVTENGVETIDFLKIDTEGYELHVLRGFENSLKKCKIIQFEYGGTFLDNNQKLIDVVRYLEEMGFHKFSYLTIAGPIPISDFTDHYQYCNIVCINKDSSYVPF
jgi:FkbM family methyltransferase